MTGLLLVRGEIILDITSAGARASIANPNINSTLLDLPKEATLPILAFLGIMFAAMAFAPYQTKRKNIW